MIDPKKIRERLCWTQVDLAKVIGVAPSTVVRWEKFETIPNIRIQIVLLEELSKVSEREDGLVICRRLLLEAQCGTFRGSYRLLQHLYEKEAFDEWIANDR